MDESNENEIENGNESETESSENEDEINYKLCCLFDKNEKKCGPYIRDRSIKLGLVDMTNLNEDTEGHFESLHFKLSLSTVKWTERSLIENRLGRKFDNSAQICENHRNTHGVCWSQPKHCAHPLHPPFKKGTKSCATSLAPLWLVEQLNNEKASSFPVGGRICYKHLQVESKKNPQRKERKKKNEENEQTDIPDTIGDDERDESYEPEQVYVPCDIQSSSVDTGNQLTDCLDISPIKFQITKTPVREISHSTRKSLQRKLKQVQEKVMKCFAESVAPTQAVELLDELLGESDDSNEEEIPKDLTPLLEPYAKSDSQGKLIILSLVDHNRHTKKVIQDVFGCTRYEVDKARRVQSSIEGVVVPTKETFRRNRLNMTKCEHFLEFLFSSGMLQDVAYGVSKVKFDSGSVQTLPHAILTAKYSHVISFYLHICKETNFDSLSETTLWRILKALKPSQRKSLAGLDDITADGMNAFTKLDNFLSHRKKEKNLSDKLEKGKRYLKSTYQNHCSMESPIASHNAAFALSTSTEEPCLDVNNQVCANCFELMSTLETILEIAKSEGNDDDVYDVNTSINSVLSYMKHQMRDHQQRKAKAYCFENLDETTAFWLKDFAQKVLPLRYREGQREYFGKKGMSLHIDVFFRKEQDNLLKYVYMTCLFRCKQSMVDILNIGDNVLNAFKQDCPVISKMYAKSDNAGCYHGNHVLEALYKMCLTKDFTLLRYDYNEPCKGKDQCDRESAGAKAVINSYVNSGNNLITANDLYNALHYGKGIKNTQVSVLEVDLDKSILQGPEIKHVSAFHSAQFFPTYMKLYRYFNIGPGVTVKYSSDSKFVPNFTLLNEFSHTQKDIVLEPCSKQKKRQDHQLCRLIFCQNPLCSDIFESQLEYERHLLSEEHTIAAQSTSMDKVRASYVREMKVSSQRHSVSSSTETDLADITLSESLTATPLMRKITEQGWALPQRVNFRYSYEQKMLLYTIFMDGEETGKKKSPEEVEMLIRTKLKPHQYVTSAQIRSLFSNFARQLKDGNLKPPTQKDQLNDDNEDNASSKRKDDDGDENLDYHIDLSHEVQQVMSRISDWEIDGYVVVRYNDLWFPGKILLVHDDGSVDNDLWFPGKILLVHDDGSVDVTCMEYVDKFERTNKFRWPSGNDRLTYDKEDLLLKIDKPTEISAGKRLQHYKLSENDFNDSSDVLKLVLN